MNKLMHAFAGLTLASLAAPAVFAGTNPVISDPNQNTAMGSGALAATFNNPLYEISLYGAFNVAAGDQALTDNTTGSYNSALGAQTLWLTTSGSYNSALGMFSLIYETTGSNNTAIGHEAGLQLYGNSQNVAVGDHALYAYQPGSYNTAIGEDALESAAGSYGIAIGAEGGNGSGSGNYNIEIGTAGGGVDANVIRIGTAGQQNAAYMAGIYGVQVGSNYAPVVVDNIGHLGTYGSAERFKTDVRSMALDQVQLERLRPVTFHLRNDPTGPLHHGLIAEEVDKIDPNLVFRDARGRIDGVHYEQLIPVLLQEVQQQNEELAAQSSELSGLEQQLARLQTALEESPKNRGGGALRSSGRP
jgi:hypothetical protein